MSFTISGDTDVWKLDDFIGFDTVGDCSANYGDITSVFVKIDNDKLFLRITFDNMILRQSNRSIRDNFSNQEIEMQLDVTNFPKRKKLFSHRFMINSLSEQKADYSFLRTPDKNLLEITINWNYKIPKEKLLFDIKILENNRIVDQFSQTSKRRDRGGNCAFVHHGNQGLTYTEVFYGQSPEETSGYDEVLQVHQATGLAGNFHMSGTLMPAAQWHNPEFNDWLFSGVQDGYVAMLTSALGQHIMPFVQNEMNNWAVSIECDMVQYRYNYIPKIAWIPERVWLAPDYYPNAGVIDWIGDNWEQHGVEGIILDDCPHCSGYSNLKIHWMSNGSGINLRVIPINNDFVGKMHYDADGAKNLISNTGQYGIAVYGTDWEVAAEMNEHHDSMFLDNYEDVLWYCSDNYPAVNVWKLDDAINNPDFNGTALEITPGTYGLLGGENGYGGGNNGWYVDWAGAASHSDFHNPTWNYGYIWNNVYEHLMNSPNNSLSQLGWYILMINLHETGWHDGDPSEISGWEHRYSSHIKNANVYAEASRWANGDFSETTGAYFDDIDRDGINELIIHNDKTLFVFENIGGKANWVFCKDEFGDAYSVVGSDVAYFSETDGDYNENSNNHFAALSDVSPNYQNDIYNMEITQNENDVAEIRL
ncbi:MAG: hypothetical protein DRJ01_17425, partial [Bacteroidetes bacterium]